MEEGSVWPIRIGHSDWDCALAIDCVALLLLSKEPNETLQCGHQFHKSCLARWIRISGRSLGHACPYRCKPEALAVMESTLLTEAAEEHVSHSAPISVDCDEEEQPILM